MTVDGLLILRVGGFLLVIAAALGIRSPVALGWLGIACWMAATLLGGR